MRRYSDEELLELLNSPESELSERKESFKGDVPTKARQAICAFSNDLSNHNHPGVLFIGARDDGTPSNFPIDDQLLLTLANIKTDGNILPFDLYPIPTAKITDLSKSKFENDYLPSAFASDILEANGRTYEERLSSCKMIVSPDDTTPTVLGLLAIGKSPQDFIPGASIQFLRIDGKELADPVIDEEKIGGALVEMLRRIEEKLKSHNRVAVDIISSATHRFDIPYPPAALQQIIYNAVLHRTYEVTNAPIRVYWFNDRIEITSPGGPYGNVTVDNFGRPGMTDYRNPNVGDVLKTYGYVQSFGRGIATAKRELASNGNPDLEFTVNESHVLCTLRQKA